MNVKPIPTDNPKADQWKLLAQFAYATNISGYLRKNGLTDTTEVVNFIAGCMRQSEVYFAATETAPLDISPLLLYYGATNLLAGALAMLTGVKPSVQHHGMTLKIAATPASRITDVEVKPVRRSDGALQHFCNVFSNSCVVVTGASWTMEEILGSIPDLRQDFENCYQTSLPHTIPVQVVQRTLHGEQFMHDRVAQTDLARFTSPLDALQSVDKLAAAYLQPRYNQPAKYISLYHKRGGTKIGTYSIFGKKYLHVAHVKNGQRLTPTQIIMMCLGLYVLGELLDPFLPPDFGEPRYVELRVIDENLNPYGALFHRV